MQATGRKEIGEAVAIAGLSALVVGLVNFGLEELKKARTRSEEKKKAASCEAAAASPDAWGKGA